MTDLEPSSDWRTWSITVPSPASEQSVTSSPLQTSATLYSIFRIIATPFLKFFSIFLSFFSFVRFLPASRFFNPRLLFSASALSLVPRFLYPRFRAYHLIDSCQRFRAFHTAHTQIIHKLSAPRIAYFCVFCTFTHLFSPTIPLIFFFFRFLLSRFSTIQCLMSDVRCFARFLFCPPAPPCAAFTAGCTFFRPHLCCGFQNTADWRMRAISRNSCASKKMPFPHREEHLP